MPEWFTSYLDSVVSLMWGVLKRFYFMLGLLLLDPWDIVERLGWEVALDARVAWALFGAGLLLSITLAYHELKTAHGVRNEKVVRLLLKAKELGARVIMTSDSPDATYERASEQYIDAMSDLRIEGEAIGGKVQTIVTEFETAGGFLVVRSTGGFIVQGEDHKPSAFELVGKLGGRADEAVAKLKKA